MVVNNTTDVWITEKDELYTDPPEPFTGKWIEWYENGQKRFEDNYKNGKLHGHSICWYEDGKIDYEDNYKDGIISKL